MKIIFLDVDGVLNSMDWFNQNKGKTGYNEINPNKVELLKEIVDNTDAKIVLSSTWRNLAKNDVEEQHPMYQYLIETLRKYRIKIYSRTPYIGDNRPKEIKTWMESQSEEIRFISLDDDFFPSEYRKYGIENCLVQTSFYEKDGGLRKEHVERAIEILNK